MRQRGETISKKIANDQPINLRVYRPVRTPSGKQVWKLVRGAVPDEVALGNQPPGPIIEYGENERR